MTTDDWNTIDASAQEPSQEQPQGPTPEGAGSGEDAWRDFAGSSEAASGGPATGAPFTGGEADFGVPTAGAPFAGEAMPQGAAQDASKDNLAIASTVVGVLSLCASLVPVCGFPLSLAAIGLGAFSLKAPNRRTLAIVGLVLGGLAILLSICSAAFGLMAMMNGQGGY